MNHGFRENVKTRILARYCSDPRTLSNIERSVYNNAIVRSGERGIIRKWTNKKFVDIYVDRLRLIVANLGMPHGAKLIESLENNTLSYELYSMMSAQEMHLERWKDLIAMKVSRENSKYTTLKGNTDIFVCRNCKANKRQSRNCSYYQLQTRSADEPMTTFVTCLECGSRWKC